MILEEAALLVETLFAGAHLLRARGVGSLGHACGAHETGERVVMSCSCRAVVLAAWDS